MSATTQPRGARRRGPRIDTRSHEYRLFALAITVIALHVVDDNYLQPQPGTSAGDHVVSGLVPIAVLGLAAWAYPRLRAVARRTLALALGVLGNRSRDRGGALHEQGRSVG